MSQGMTMTETSGLAPVAQSVSFIPSIFIGASNGASSYGIFKSIALLLGHLTLDFISYYLSASLYDQECQANTIATSQWDLTRFWV